jgi:hypothetical protein
MELSKKGKKGKGRRVVKNVGDSKDGKTPASIQGPRINLGRIAPLH